MKAKKAEKLSQEDLDWIEGHKASNEFVRQIDTKQISVDIGGHNRAAQRGMLYASANIKMGMYSISNADLLRLKPVLADPNSPPLAEPIRLKYGLGDRCCECDERIELQTDGKSITCPTPCKYPDGYPEIVFELNVPSGKMVVGNDYRRKFRVMGDFNINTRVGLAKTSLKYAEAGLAHAFVGNTCPSMWKINDGYFAIGVMGEEEKPPLGGTQVAGVCTDLWWYSIADYDQFVQRYKEIDAHGDCVVDCRPGVYRFTHQYHRLNNDDYTKAQVYTTVEWVRNPDPVVDFEAEFLKLNLAAGQVLANKMNKYPDLFSTVQRAADQLLVVSGNGADWHPNGWCCSDAGIDLNIEPVQIPVFDQKYHWYGLDEYSLLCNCAGVGKPLLTRTREEHYLNESFTALAFNILRCIVVHGVEERPMYKDRAKTTVKWAKKALVGLAKKYPDRIPDNCRELLKKSRKSRSKKA